MKLYKLTDENGRTHGGTQWGEGVTHTASGSKDQELCTDGWIHAYEHPLLAVLLNPIHADFAKPQLWEAEGEVGKRDHGLKVGVRSLTTVRRIDLPEVSTEQRVKFGILCALQVYKDRKFVAWADNWISGKDRSAGAAGAAGAAAAARAAEAAARAAWVAEAAGAAAAAWAAGAAGAAGAAARAAAGAAGDFINLAAIAETAVQS